MLETEYKSMLDKETFEKILNMYKWEETITQTNHYYAGKDNTLRKNGITFRIREIDGSFKVQIKNHKKSETALQISEEKEFYTDSVPMNISAETVKEYTGIDAGEVCNIGSSTTIRRIFRDGETELCLDKTTYLDTEDFEVEVEYVDTCSESIMSDLKKLGVTFEKKTPGKYSRFIKRLNEALL